jgi:hypothetical protein
MLQHVGVCAQEGQRRIRLHDPMGKAITRVRSRSREKASKLSVVRRREHPLWFVLCLGVAQLLSSSCHSQLPSSSRHSETGEER